jgi:hypothetical protein
MKHRESTYKNTNNNYNKNNAYNRNYINTRNDNSQNSYRSRAFANYADSNSMYDRLTQTIAMMTVIGAFTILYSRENNNSSYISSKKDDMPYKPKIEAILTNNETLSKRKKSYKPTFFRKVYSGMNGELSDRFANRECQKGYNRRQHM